MKINRLAKSKVELVEEIAWSEFEPYLTKAVEKLGKSIEVKGFRPGRAPRDIIKKQIGSDKILAEAGQIAIQEKYLEALSKENLEPISQPQAQVLKLAQDNPFVFKVHLEVMPEINLPDYQKIADGVQKKEVKVEEKEVEQALKWLQKTKADFKQLNRPAQKNDFVSIRYSSPQVENNKEFKDAFVLGQGHLIQGFEQNLEAMKTGQQKEFNAEFPKEYFKKELAGKKADFKVKMEKIEQMILSELNDEFAKKVGKFKDLAELKASIRYGITKEKEITELGNTRQEILEKIAEQTNFDLPESLLWAEQERMLKQISDTSDKELLEHEKKQTQKAAEQKVKTFLILRAIGKKENIQVSEQEAEQAAKQFSGKEQVDPERLKEYYKSVLYNEKTFQKICQ